MSVLELEFRRGGAFVDELRKVPAFIRRDFLVAWSYRMSFFSDLVNLAGQIVVFYFVGRLVDEDLLPKFNGTSVTYLEFAAIGIVLGIFIQLGLDRVSTAMRAEQLMGEIRELVKANSPDVAKLRQLTGDLQQVAAALASAAYSQAASTGAKAGGPDGGQSASSDDVIDAEFKQTK